MLASTIVNIAAMFGTRPRARFLIQSSVVKSAYIILKLGSVEVGVEVGENNERQFENPSFHPFFDAVVKNDIERIDELVKEGVIIDYQNENGWTPAIYAVENHKYESLLKVSREY